MSDLLDIRQFGEGQQIELPVIKNRRNWRMWYEGDFATLLGRQATADNGLVAISNHQDIIRRNLLHTASDFYQNAVLSEPPAVTSSKPKFEGWWRDNSDYVLKQLRLAVQGWSHGGRAVLVSFSNGRVVPVNPENYLRVGPIYQSQEEVGHIIIHTYRAYDPNELKQTYQYTVPNRILVYRYSEQLGVNSMHEYELSGMVVGRELFSTEAGITSILVAGDNDSWYPDVEDTFFALLIRGTLNHAAINRYQNRSSVFPSTTMTQMKRDLGLPSSATAIEAVQALENKAHPAIVTRSVGDQTGAQAIDIGNADRVLETLQQEQHLLDQFYLLAGIPPAVFGVNIGRGESGSARERTTDRSRSRVENVRKDIARGLPTLLRGVGCPIAPENIQVAWAHPPFSDQSAEEQAVVARLQAGIITVDEARAEMGYPPMPVDMQTQLVRQSEQQGESDPQSGE